MALPPGTPVPTHAAPYPSKHIHLTGKHVSIVPLSPSHAEEMYAQTSGPQNTSLFTHLLDGPYSSLSSYETTATAQAADEKQIFYTILLNPSDGRAEEQGRPVGRVALINIVPANRTCEIGHVLFSPLLSRSTAATEAVYLLARHVFEDLDYRRLEWKCDVLNLPSRKAALRYGFVHEGVFRQHMIVRGRSRDTWWGSIVDGEWFGGSGTAAEGREGVTEGTGKGVKWAFEQWLDEGNFDVEGRQRRRLEDFRRA